MKKFTQSTTALLLTLILALGLTACGGEKADTTTENAQTSSAEENKEISKTGVWENAAYLSDTTLGEGEKSFTLEVKAEEQTVTFTISTDSETVGDALLENGLIAGDEGSYGLYVKKVNGITADYDIDQTYWSFYIDGEYASSGVDTTEITEGTVYQLVYTK